MECNFKKKIELLIPGSWQRATNMVFSASSENFIQNAIEGNRGHLIGTLPDRQFIRVPPRPINEINLIHCTQHREQIISHILITRPIADPWKLFFFALVLWRWKRPILLICLPLKRICMFSNENNFKTYKCILVFSYYCYTWKQRTFWQKEFLACLTWNKHIAYCAFKIDLQLAMSLISLILILKFNFTCDTFSRHS